MPEIIGEFKFANLFDGMDGDVPVVYGRPSLPTGEERERFLTYVSQGASLLTFRSLAKDALDPDQPEQVQRVYRTDGEWMWSSEVAYYLQEHDVPPDPEFVEYPRARDYRYIAPSPDRVAAASEALAAE